MLQGVWKHWVLHVKSQKVETNHCFPQIVARPAGWFLQILGQVTQTSIHCSGHSHISCCNCDLAPDRAQGSPDCVLTLAWDSTAGAYRSAVHSKHCALPLPSKATGTIAQTQTEALQSEWGESFFSLRWFSSLTMTCHSSFKNNWIGRRVSK